VQAEYSLWLKIKFSDYSKLSFSLAYRMWQRAHIRTCFVAVRMYACVELNLAINYVRFEVFTAVTMKNGVFWDVTPSGKEPQEPRGVTSQKTQLFLVINL
jgi:hypothetical protein